MHRRTLGRGRLLAIVSALVMLAGCVLPWYTVGGGEELPAQQFTAFSGSGILVFLAALATIALVALPYAAGDRPVGADRWLAYVLLAIAAWVGLAVWPLDLVGVFAQGLLPDRAPGLWVSAVGAIGLSRAAYDIAHEPGLR